MSFVWKNDFRVQNEKLQFYKEFSYWLAIGDNDNWKNDFWVQNEKQFSYKDFFPPTLCNEMTETLHPSKGV